eukprot:403330750
MQQYCQKGLLQEEDLEIKMERDVQQLEAGSLKIIRINVQNQSQIKMSTILRAFCFKFSKQLSINTSN